MNWKVALLGVFFSGLAVAAEAPRPQFKKILVIVLENTDAANALAQPNLRKFANQGAYLNQFYAITHPSQPNYLAMIGGDTFGISDNGDVNLGESNLVDLLESHGHTWKAYNEGYPGGCFAGTKSGKYYRKHNPFISFKDISGNPERCRYIVNANEFAQDVAKGTLADFSFYVPDIDNDGHDTGVMGADRWFGQVIMPYLEKPAFMRDMLVVVTFDESSSSGSNRIYTALFGENVKAGMVSEQPYTLYSLLQTVEGVFGLGNLGRNDTRAKPIQDVWKN